MQFEFATAERILFGWGSSKKLSFNQFGSRLMLVTGSRAPALNRYASRFVVVGEPTVQLVRRASKPFEERTATWWSGLAVGA